MNIFGSKRASDAWIDRLLRNAMLGGVSTLAIVAYAMPAAAQDESQPVETVVVTGIRGSLQRSLDIKRQSLGEVDAITAEDIGKFPDVNLADAMMRIPGVTITRGIGSPTGTGEGTGSTTSTGEASEITVRGFGPTFNETLFDGRVVATGTGDRAFDFSSVNSDFVSQISVLKTPDATLSSGAIGATVDIKFPKPFDHPGLVVAGSFSGTVSPENGKWSPNGDALISDTFDNDHFGILAAFSYEDTKTRENHINIQGWEGKRASEFSSFTTTVDPNTPVWFIQDYGIYQEHSNVERMQGRLVLQWRPTDAVEITLNDNYSRDHNSELQNGFSVWFNNGSMQNVQLDSNGTITSFVQNNTPTDFQGQINSEVLEFNDFGANVKWNVNDNLTITLDGDHAEGWLNPGGQYSEIDSDVGYGPSQAACSSATDPTCQTLNYAGGLYGVNIGIVVPNGHALPYPTDFGPSGNESMFINNGLIGSHVFPIASNQNLDTVNQVKAMGEWNEDKVDLKFGFQYVGEHKNEAGYDTFENNNWQAYSGYGAASNNYYWHGTPGDPYLGQPAGATLPQSMFTNSYSTSGFINGWSGSGNLPAGILVYNPYTVLAYLQGLGNPQSMVIPGYNGIGSGCCAANGSGDAGRPFDGVYQLAFNPSSYHVLEEKTYSGFVSASLKSEVASMPLTVNVGARYDYTQENVTGLGRVPTAFAIDPADHTAYDITYTSTTNVSQSHSYQYLLPNLDLILGVSDDFDLRLDVSRTLTRPPISNLNPVYSITAQRTNDVAASGGNPNLLPFLSDNVDLVGQWYYAPNSYLSVDAFLKSVDNFIVQGSVQGVFNGVGPGGSDISYTLTAPTNGPAANVYGLELTIQHMLGDTGFGFVANGTIVGTDKPYDPYDLNVSGFAVTGLADSANLVAFYDKNGFQARVAMNWQDSYLDHFGQLQNGSEFGTEPTFVNTNWNIDFSTSYDITEQISAYFEAFNLTDATYSTHGRFSNQVLDVVDYGRKFLVGVHFKL